jgi:hypothetical protein
LPSSEFYKAPLVVGVRQFADWQEAGSIEETLYGLGANTGNILFTQSLLAVLENSKPGTFQVAPSEFEGCDVIVVACANWINSFDDFGWLADRLAKTPLPVVLVGIGAQATLTMEVPAVKEGTLRLLSLAAERSQSISVRGAFSCEVLGKLGFSDAVPTGCPSLLLAGPAGPSIRVSEDLSFDSACVHATRHGGRAVSPFEETLYRLALRKEMDIVLQSEVPDIHLAMGKQLPEKRNGFLEGVLTNTYGTENYQVIKDFLFRHGYSFTNYRDWIEYAKTRTFCFGTRIHGTIASIISGTPATLIAHDSRTLEMAQAMSIPYMLQRDFEKVDTNDIRSIVLPEELLNMSSNYAGYRDRFEEFFASNSLALRGR